MKCLYKSSLYLLFFLFAMLAAIESGHARCPDGQPEGGTAYDTTILIPAGIVSKNVKFPQFDPQSGINGVVDTVPLQNFSSSGQVGSYTYDRTDEITGPGIGTPLSSTANLSFGPFPLKAYDGIAGAGPDFYSAGPDHYEAEVSKNGKKFSSIGTVPKRNQVNTTYRLNYAVGNGESGMYYFRIKQVYTNGYVRYSNIKQMELESSVAAKFSVYPNPSAGIVGIKFDNKMHGHFKIQIYNTQGQVVAKKDIVVTVGSPSIQVAALVPGVYWLRVTDEKNLDSGVTQLFIK